MSEINVRIWDKKNNQYAPVECVLGFIIGYQKGHILRLNDDNYINERYINKKDINGKPICENDKLKVKSEHDEYSEFEWWHVTLSDPFYPMLEGPDGSDCIPMFSFEYKAEFEIIGNIHSEG